MAGMAYTPIIIHPFAEKVNHFCAPAAARLTFPAEHGKIELSKFPFVSWYGIIVEKENFESDAF